MSNTITPSGDLTKLKFIAYKDISFAEDKKGDEYQVMFNPSNIAVKLQVERDGNQADGSTSAEMKFKRIKPQDYSFEFIIDGTGANGGGKKEVPDEVGKFLKIIYYLEGDTHHPNYVKILYGAVLLKCVLKSVDVTYTLFSANAKPLRAKVNATFTSCVDQTLSEMMNNKSSPDLTHVRKVKRGEKLVSMAYKIYKKNTWYLEVAKANQFDSFRNLSEGTQVFFPPVSKTE